MEREILNEEGMQELRFDEEMAQAVPPLHGMTPETTTQEMLLHMVGRYAVAELLIAPGTFYIREGVLMQVTKNFFLLYDENLNARVACDIHALAMLTVFPAGIRPKYMSPEEKCKYIGELRREQECRMQALPTACATPPGHAEPMAIPVAGYMARQSMGTPVMMFNDPPHANG